MYPRNNAAPEPIAIGAVIQISDGAVQTSGVSVRIRSGGSESAGAGSIGYSTDGVVLYTPTQSETNVSSFILIASKAGCFPVAFMVVTTDASTPGRVRLDGVTHTSAVIPTVTAVTNAVTLPASASINITGNITGNLSGSVGSVTGAVGSVTGNVGGNVVGSVGSVTGAVGSISGVTFPTNFSALGINASGHVSRVVLVDTTTTNTDMISAAGIRSAVGLASANLDTQLAAIDAVTDKMDTMLVLDGAVWQLTVNALENAPSGGGGGSGDASQATLLLVKAKTDLINPGTVTVNSPTTATGSVRPIVIGDDYLAANGRAFTWTIPAVTGVTAGTAQVYFGGTSATDSFLAGPGTATDNGNGTWTLSVDMPRAISSLRKEEQYEWTVGVQAAGGNKITPVRWGERLVFVESHTW